MAVGGIWNGLDEGLISNEASVELHVVLPLLESLGYTGEDIAPKHPVIRKQGRGRKPEADFVVFYGAQRTKSNSLITIEAKAPGESFSDAKAQGESYAQAIGTPLLLVTDGRLLEIWQLQPSSDSECVLHCSLTKIGENRARIEALLSREAAYAFCKTLQQKSALSAAVDLSAYLRSEFASHTGTTHSWQRSLSVGAQQDASVSADQVLARFPQGAVISGASGFGKSTLAYQLLLQSVEAHSDRQNTPIPCQIQLADMAASKQSIIVYVHARIHAHCPAVGEALLYELARERGLALFCDGFDRLIHEQARTIEAALREVVRDYPHSQIFIFTRPGALPDLPMPELSLRPLSRDEQQALLEAQLLDTPEAECMLRNMPQSLSRLASHPLLLARICSYWQVHRSYPSRLDALFEAWLDQLLARKTQPLSYLTTLRRGLTVLAEITAASPVQAAHVLDLFASMGIADKVLDELVLRDAARNSGMTIELHHEALADYLRALEVASSDSRFEAFLKQPLAAQDSLFPVLLMAVLPTRERQKLLWEKLAQTSLSTYLEALRYRANVVTEFDQQETTAAAESYLADLLSGIEELSHGFFPHLHGAIMQQLTGCDIGELAISGELTNDRQWINYCIDIVSDIATSRVNASEPGGRRYGVGLKMSDLRIDSGRLLGAKRLLECLGEVIGARNLKGREVWINERLLGRVRFLEHEYWKARPRSYGLQELYDLLSPDADMLVMPGFRALPCFTVQSMLDDIRWLLQHGQKKLEPWWLAHVDPVSLTPQTESEHQYLLDEHFRRVQLAYVEVCEESLPAFANESGMYCAMPMRYEVCLTPYAHRAMHFRWKPVAEWCRAGADVSFVDEIPTDFLQQDFQELEQEIKSLGRCSGGSLKMGGWMAHVPSSVGYTWNGSFTGETSVMHEVCEWIQEDVERLFRLLPQRDSD